MSNPTGKGGFKDNPDNIDKSGGVAPAWTWASIMKEECEELDIDGIPFKRKIARKVVRQAAKGDVPSIKELTNRTDGMPNQNLNVEGNVTISFHDSLKQDEQ